MNLIKWAESRARTFRWYEFSLLKIALLSLGFALAGLIPEIMKIEWYWYFVIYLVAIALPLKRMFNTNN